LKELRVEQRRLVLVRPKGAFVELAELGPVAVYTRLEKRRRRVHVGRVDASRPAFKGWQAADIGSALDGPVGPPARRRR